MKIRNGFVSNSSSSSFVVAFDKKPKTKEALKKLMFDDKKSVDYYGDIILVDDIVERVFDDLQGQETLTKDKVVEIISSGSFDGYPERDYNKRSPADKISDKYYKTTRQSIHQLDPDSTIYKKYAKLRDKEWADQAKEVDIAAAKYLEKIWKDFEGKKVYSFEYSDNGGGPLGSAMEHSGIFDYLPHIQISHH